MDSISSLWFCVGRRDDYAVQQPTGHYLRQFHPLNDQVLRRHLEGRLTIGAYVLSEMGTCSFAVFDADMPDGMQTLRDLQAALVGQGYPAYLERSRRGGHLWVFFAEPVSSEVVRAWLWPLAAARNLELFPKQAGGNGIGSLIRVPLGVHQRSGKRYPFVDADLRSVARSLPAMLEWLANVERARVPSISMSTPITTVPAASSLALPSLEVGVPSLRSIRDWNAAQDPFALIGRYVALDRRGSGHCPFLEHHQGSRDTHASFRVYFPRRAGGSCWFCYAWGRGGSAFDFLRLYHNLDARTLWQRIIKNEI